MMIQSNVNTASFKNSFNHMKTTEQQHKKASREVASGKKVNTAADDAVALAISQQILKQSNSLKTGSDNISYGIDATKIADGALANVTDSLGDIQQNTIRAMNGLYSESDRAILQEANKQSVETGDVLHYVITGKVPVINDGDSYYYYVWDSLSAGQQYVPGSLKIYMPKNQDSPAYRTDYVDIVANGTMSQVTDLDVDLGGDQYHVRPNNADPDANTPWTFDININLSNTLFIGCLSRCFCCLLSGKWSGLFRTFET